MVPCLPFHARAVQLSLRLIRPYLVNAESDGAQPPNELREELAPSDRLHGRSSPTVPAFLLHRSRLTRIDRVRPVSRSTMTGTSRTGRLRILERIRAQ